MMKRRSGARAQRAFDFRRLTKRGRRAKKPGRKKTGRRSDPRHRPRPEVRAHHPVHVVLRVTAAVSTLRGFHQYHALRGALGHAADARTDCRVVHVSIQSNHIHLLCEADSRHALARGMQGFAISAAKRLNRALGRTKGQVFAHRYHATAIRNPTQARNAIAYILNNWRRHRADLHARWRVDPYSSAWAFFGTARPREPLPVVDATAWLLTEGWSRAGPIMPTEIPGPDPDP